MDGSFTIRHILGCTVVQSRVGPVKRHLTVKGIAYDAESIENLIRSGAPAYGATRTDGMVSRVEYNF